jgi:hypothetical protein
VSSEWYTYVRFRIIKMTFDRLTNIKPPPAIIVDYKTADEDSFYKVKFVEPCFEHFSACKDTETLFHCIHHSTL